MAMDLPSQPSTEVEASIRIEGEMNSVWLQHPAVNDDGVSTSVSVLDKLIHTHPIWLLLSIDQQEATDVLLQQPTGVFLVWRSSVLQKKVLSFHTDDASDSTVIHIPVKESQYTFSLEGSGISFADLFHLVAFYCISRDILSSTLKLPEAIRSSETLSDLHEVAQQGAAFWKSSFNREQGALSGSDSSLVEDSPLISLHANCSEVLQVEDHSCTPTGQINIPIEACLSALKINGSCSSSALYFINPAFSQTQEHLAGNNPVFSLTQEQLAGNTTTVIAKDPTAVNGKPCPPPRPPPPQRLVHSPTVPLGPKTMPLSTGFNRLSQRSKSSAAPKKPAQCHPPPRPPQQPDIDSYRCTIALDDETISRALSRANLPHTSPVNQTSSTVQQQWTGPDEKEGNSSGRSLSTSSSNSLDSSPHPIPLGLCQSMGQGLSMDDSSDEHNIEEEDYCVGLERDLHLRLQTSCKSKRLLAVELVGAHPGSLVIVPRVLRGHLRKVRGVLSVLATPERRILMQILELAQDKRSYFGCLVQDYVSFVQENKNCHSSSQDLLQTLRQFMTQMKAYLIQSSEMNPPIESYIPEDQIDPVLEKAMHKCVLKPLYGSVQSVLQQFQEASGTWQRLQKNLAQAKTKQPRELGANIARPPDAHAIHRIRQKLRAMCRMYSPERKIVVLLKVCKLIYNIMQDHAVRMFGADDFLPMLTYVLVQCDMPQLDTEVLYMMELIDPPLLHGEGGYYLTSAYGAMSLIKNFQEEQAAQILSSATRDTLHQWHQRRTLQRNLPSVDDFQNYLRVALQKADSGCTAKTLQVRPYATTEEVCRLCALKFQVSDPENYGLFLLANDSSQQLSADTHPQWIKAELHSRPHPQPFYFVYRKILNINGCTLAQ